ncbi:hypothetical protein ABZ330_26455 [Streptomyces sp. NPDC006172]|uniref:hypothetical protein n=1 Tax=Streptomyces sp. NPDC006172 TaxID=3154470 RepID=UPI003409D2DB
MADERCAHPGDDEPSGDPAARRRPGRWLDARTAERLLDGDAPDNAVAPAHRDEAERLARTLDALAALSDPPVPPDEELPGEASALAAFRKIHADRTTPTTAYIDSRDSAAHVGFREAPDDGADAQVVRIGAGRPERTPSRRSRSVRLGAAAALAVGMAGGVAAATGVGGIPGPFHAAEPAPVTSVSAAATPGPPPRPLDSPSPPLSPSPSPGAGHGDRAGPDTPGGTASGPAAPSAGGKAGDAGDGGGPGVGNRRGWPNGVPAACRDLRDGKILNQQRRRSLESAAGGVWRVAAYCAHVLITPDGPSGTGTGTDTGTGSGTGTDSGKPGGQGRSGGHGQNGWGGPYGGSGGGEGAGWGGGRPGLGAGHGHGPDHGRDHGRGGNGDKGADGGHGAEDGDSDGGTTGADD